MIAAEGTAHQDCWSERSWQRESELRAIRSESESVAVVARYLVRQAEGSDTIASSGDSIGV